MAEPDEVERPRRPWLHAVLFVVTCGTTFIAGASMGDQFEVWRGFAFGGTLMFILTCHEMGHYLVARRHGIDASLPYFIPLPPFISLGTMGAVIRMKDPIANRDHLIDVGAAGPLAGLAVAIPLLIYGLSLSPVGPSPPVGTLEGNSILYLGLKYLVHGQILPASDGTDVALHPIGFAAWFGLLVTFINLIPIGQLDGGHVAASFLGERHERLSARLHRSLLVVGVGAFLWLALDARSHGLAWAAAGWYALNGALPWLVWSVLLVVLRRMSGGRYHPPAEGPPLGAARRWLVLLMALIFIVIFTPVPLREVLPP